VKPTLGANMGNIVVLFKLIRVWRIVMMRNTPKCDDVSHAKPGAREKGARDPYQDPTLVPLV
jgi:hypothetical protein